MFKKIITFTFLMAMSSISFAEVIICEASLPSSPDVKFQIQVDMDKAVSSIRYFYPDGGGFTNGLGINYRKYKDQKIIYADKFDTSVSLTLDDPSSAQPIGFYNHSKGGHKNTQVHCLVSGKIPEQKPCPTENVDEGLVSLIKNNQDIDTIERQIECKADVNFKDKNGCTAVMFAVDPYCGSGYSSFISYNRQRPAIVDLLVSNGAYADLADKSGETALIKAAKNKIPDVFESLYAAEVDFNAQDHKGNTVLMYASLTNDPYYVEDVLIGNPDRTIKNKLGQTAYDFAKHWGMDRVLDLLRAPELTLTISGDSDGNCTPLNLEVQQNELVEVVLEAQKTMIKLEIPSIKTEIIASSMTSAKKVISFPDKGSFEFSCGPHHGGTPTKGTILVK